MTIYQTHFYKTRCIYFLIKEEKSLEKYNEMWGKVSNIIKRNLIVNLHIIKKNLRAEKKINAKEGFQCNID